MKKLFFVPGGPGLNSNPERAMLSGLWRSWGFDCFFYDEPDRMRGDQRSGITYDDHLDELLNCFDRFCAEEKAVIVSHSFGAFSAELLVRKRIERVDSLKLISPCYYPGKVDDRIIRLGKEHMSKIHSPHLETLATLDLDRRKTFDEATVRALRLVAQNLDFMGNYFCDIFLKEMYQSYLRGCFAFSLDNFINIRSTFPNVDEISEPLGVECSVIWGQFENMIALEQEMRRVRSIFPDAKVATISKTSHFPHLEKMLEFGNELKGPSRRNSHPNVPLLNLIQRQF